MRIFALLLSLIVLSGLTPLNLSAQVDTGKRYVRVWLTDKGVPDKVLEPGEPLYGSATAHLTSRALERRAKTIDPDSLVSTRDLPLHNSYVDSIVSFGALELQRSRWMNTIMVAADSATAERVVRSDFVDSIQVFGPYVDAIPNGLGKFALEESVMDVLVQRIDEGSRDCLTGQYGVADRQLRQVGFDVPHAIGVSGRGVLVGVLDAGFDWRSHPALVDADVIAEYDFVNHDSNTFDEPGQFPSESHGTLVMSLIGGMERGTFVGGAPDVRFALAKTEDVASEKRIEEDNFVAGLEWLESLGVDVTNTSLGYTTFDPLEPSHSIEGDLDGRSTIASRAINHATRLGVVSVVAAGNDFRGFRYVGVPGEADSAIAIAAVDSLGDVANFSSRGSEVFDRSKPDLAAPGVHVFGAILSDEAPFAATQGTSLASPLATSAVALLLSVRPDLRPWEIRELLQTTSANADSPDTAVGHGLIQLGKALQKMSAERPLVGFPTLRWDNGDLVVGAWIADDQSIGVHEYSLLRDDDERLCRVTNVRTNESLDVSARQPAHGANIWYFSDAVENLGVRDSDTLEVALMEYPNSQPLTQSRVEYRSVETDDAMTPCFPIPPLDFATERVVPNPFDNTSRVEFFLEKSSAITLTLFSLSGKQVLTPVTEEHHAAGFHSIRVDTGGLPAGPYVYRLQTGDHVRSGTMIRY